MTQREILVAGATGRIGGIVARELTARGLEPRVLVRDLQRARETLPPGVIPIVGDLDDPDSLGPAVAGVDALLLVSPVNPRQCVLQRNLVRAAANSGDPLVVKISGLGTRLDSFVDSGRWHAETERDIRDVGLPFTFLRPYFFMQNVGVQLEAARKDGVLRAGVSDARIAMIDARDIAAVAARLLAGEVDRHSEELDLTGPEALGYEDVAVRVGEALGRTVAYQPQDADDLRAFLERTGMPDWHIEILLQFNRAFAKGWGARTSDCVEQVLGRPARSFATYLEDTLHGTYAKQTTSGAH
jgi:uncharacterized protein YbjT (DUF2867 family)